LSPARYLTFFCLFDFLRLGIEPFKQTEREIKNVFYIPFAQGSSMCPVIAILLDTTGKVMQTFRKKFLFEQPREPKAQVAPLF